MTVRLLAWMTVRALALGPVRAVVLVVPLVLHALTAQLHAVAVLLGQRVVTVIIHAVMNAVVLQQVTHALSVEIIAPTHVLESA